MTPSPTVTAEDTRPSIHVVTTPSLSSSAGLTPPTSPSESGPNKVALYAARRASSHRLYVHEQYQAHLQPIPEDELREREALKQTVEFTERLAAVKVFIETQYHEIEKQELSPRSLRRRQMELSLYVTGKSVRQSSDVRRKFNQEESNHLRRVRLSKARRLHQNQDVAAVGYQPLRILGKGSFGLVRLVRDLSEGHGSARQVYAMKAIRKDEMLRSCQEAHLKAERDFLVAASGRSKWVVPLRASFQDPQNLYLIMDYAIGGDFLGLLLRKEVIPEASARFYAAEMVSCIEEAHNMGWIHRDVKPDNFLISASGHLKISDFGLAFDGDWAHTQAYFQHRRYSLLEKLDIQITGDAEDQSRDQDKPGESRSAACSNKRSNLCAEDPRGLRRRLARSVVGTSQYMAPEVVQGGPYDGRCD